MLSAEGALVHGAQGGAEGDDVGLPAGLRSERRRCAPRQRQTPYPNPKGPKYPNIEYIWFLY